MTSRSTLAARPLILGKAADSGAHRHPAQYITSETYHHPLPPPLAFCQPLLILWLTTQLPFQVPTPEFLVDSVLPLSPPTTSILLPYSLHPPSSSSSSFSPPVPTQTILPLANVHSLIKNHFWESHPLGNLLGRSHFVMSQAGFPL